METEFRWSGLDAQVDLEVDASSATRLDIGQGIALRRAKRAWTSSLESASSAVSLAIWPASAGTDLYNQPHPSNTSDGTTKRRSDETFN